MRAARVDANHRQIVEALTAAGWRVISTARMGGGFPDLFAWKRGKGWRAVEVKVAKGKLTRDQRAFHEEFPDVHIIRTVEDAVRLA